MNSKKAITLLVLVTLLMSMVPMVPFANAALEEATIDIENDDLELTWNLVNAGEVDQAYGEVENLIKIEGEEDSVSSGYDVNIYWGKIQSWNGEKGLLNTTEADDDGGYEIWFEVPVAVNGTHSLWITATDQSETVRTEFQVISDVDVSSSSGLADSKVYVDLWGFDDEEEAAILFVPETDLGGEMPRTQSEWNLLEVVGEELLDPTTVTDVFGPFTLAYDKTDVDDVPAMTIKLDAEVIGTWNGAALVAGAGAHAIEGIGATSTFVEATGVLNLDLAADAAAGQVISVDYSVQYFVVAGEVTGETGVADEDDDGTAANGMIEPGTFRIEAAGLGTNGLTDVEPAGGKSDGSLYDDNGDDIGSVNYITGEWSFDNEDSTGEELIGALTLDYQYFDDIDDFCYVLTSSGITDDLGTWENKRVTIPDATVAQYYLVGMDGKNNTAYDDFEIGAIITLSETSGPVGSKVEIDGAGFDVGDEITVTVGGVPAHIIDSEDAPGGADADIVDGDGEFTFSIIIPQVDDEDDYDIVCTAAPGGDNPSVEYEVTALASISVDPDFGPQGSTVTVTGENFPNVKDVEVEIWLTTTGGVDVIEIDQADTDADGTFSVDITVPTENDDSYEIEARTPADDDGAYTIVDDIDFRIGTILVLLSKDEAVVGDRVVLTGNGFTDAGEWNATFGDVVIFSEEAVNNDGLLKVDGDTPEFFVPQLPVGDYVITVWDSDAEIMIETDFTVSAYTTLDFGTLEAPNDFNVSINGWYWPENGGNLNANADIEFVLWNETDEWDMVVEQRNHATGARFDPALLNTTGYLVDGWWMVPDDDTLSKGTYHVNATLETDNDQSYEMFLDFVVGDVYEVITPRKATFRVGDTVSFNVEHSFGGQAGTIDQSTITVYDPEGDVYWEIDGYDINDWFSVDKYWTLKAAAQTDGGNPCVLLDDAPLGEWSYLWEEEGGDDILEGTFMVEASAENIVNEAVADLANQIDALTADLSGVTEDFDDVKSDISGVLAVAQEAVAAANAATEAVNAVATQANNAGAAAEAAQEAAENAANAASGLTTLVYGAIGAALVAALAAIVSLMQISRRIAG